MSALRTDQTFKDASQMPNSGPLQTFQLGAAIETLNGVDPRAWLTYALGRIAEHRITHLDEILPWRYAAKATHDGKCSLKFHFYANAVKGFVR
jgi:hypothetical protein